MTTKAIKTEKIGDVTASLYLERNGYTYKIRTRIGGRVQVVARSYAWLTDKQDAIERMRADLYHITQQLSLFDERIK